MKILKYFLAAFIICGMLACGTTSSKNDQPDNQNNQNNHGDSSSYTSADAIKMFKSFNSKYFNKNKNLYNMHIRNSRLAVGWTQAIYMYMLMDAYKQTKNEKYLDMVEKLYQGGKDKYSNFVWSAVKQSNGWIYDDMMWWIGGLARAYKITKKQKYLETAKEGFAFVWADAYKHGGIIWSWKSPGYTASSNYPTVIAAMRLYNITGDKMYFTKAKKIYSWARKNLFNEVTGEVGDNTQYKGPPTYQDHTYDQGMLIYAAYMLYKATGNQMYMEDARAAANYTKNVMSNSNGILPSSGGEGALFNTIFIHYLALFIKKGDQTQYRAWMQHNAEEAWVNRNKIKDLMCSDYTVKCTKFNLSSYAASSGVELLLVIPLSSKAEN